MIVKANADIVDISFFGWPRLSSPKKRFKEEAKEEAFCRLLLKAGGKFYSSLRRYHHAIRWYGLGANGEEAIDSFYAWPGITTHLDSSYVFPTPDEPMGSEKRV